MSFYQSIAGYYEQIFPLNESQIAFVANSFKNPSHLAVLDIGCGTGSLSLKLTDHFDKVTAIDLDEAMLEKARQKNDNEVSFLKLDMLEIEKQFGHKAFDAVICFGNTLVHLNGPEAVFDFFVQSKKVLRDNGKLLFQIINYDRIIGQGIKGLPTIENDTIRFQRNYYYHPGRDRIDFETILTVKPTGRVIQNTIPLYPLRKKETGELLKKAGFNRVHYYGNFKKGELNTDSIPLIVEAQCSIHTT